MGTCYRVKNAGRCMPRLDAEGDLEWPMLFFYEEYSQTDFVEFWNLLVPLESLLQNMFPGDRHADWDKHRTYVWDNLVVYMEFYVGLAKDAKDTDFVAVDAQKAPMEYLIGRGIPPCL